MDTELLLKIFHIPASSGNEEKMATFIKDYLDAFNLEYTTDDKGNIFNINNKNKPLLAAHMDTVQDNVDESLASFTKIRGNILSGLGVIGADDKNGIFIILEILKITKDINFAFFVEEEVGAIGSGYFINQNFNELEHIPYGLVLDRRGKGDIICDNNSYGTLEFEKALVEVGKIFEYTPATGSFSDADNLSEEISCANLSCGYYNPHQKTEYVKLNELQNTLNYVIHIISTITKKFEAPARTYYYNKKQKSKKGYNYYMCDDYDYNIEKCDLCDEWKSEFVYLRKQRKYICDDCFKDLESAFDVKNYDEDWKKEMDKEKDITPEDINYLLEM